MSDAEITERAAEKLAQAHAHLEELVGAEVSPAIVSSAAESLTTSLATLRQAREARESTAAARALHRIRGVLVNLGLEDLASTAGALERGIVELSTPPWDTKADGLETFLLVFVALARPAP